MKFTLTIDCDNAAFDDLYEEIARILRAAAQRVEDGSSGGSIRDANGNQVSDYSITGRK